MNTYIFISIIIFLTTSLAFTSYKLEFVNSRFLFIKGILIYGICYLVSEVMGDRTFLDSMTQLEASLDYEGILIHGFLSYLLFAGALHIKIKLFFEKLPEILTLAIITTALATFLTALLLFSASSYLGYPLSPIACMLFAACVSPTDPIAVIALLKNVKLPHSIETKIAGESLLNDGIGIVFFTTFLHMASAETLNVINLSSLFFREAIGGLLIGFLTSFTWAQLIQKTLHRDYSPKLDIYWSLSLVNLVYLVGTALDVSVPLACVSAGLTTSYQLADFSNARYRTLLNFWDVVDDLLNTIIFFLTGTLVFRVMTLHSISDLLITSVLITCFTRVISVYLPIKYILFWRSQYKNLISVVSLSGLKGGLSLALALSIPNSIPGHEIIFAMTFSVVAFTLIIQSTAVSAYAQYLYDNGKL